MRRLWALDLLLVSVVFVIGLWWWQKLPSEILLLNGQPIRVEIAATHESISEGLSQRESLAAEQGMLFIYDSPRLVSFWMKDMHFPVDMLFFDTRGCLVNYHDQVPSCAIDPCPKYSSDAKVDRVLELVAGSRVRLGVKLGQCPLSATAGTTIN